MERRNSCVFFTPSYHTFVQFHKKLLLISIESSLRYTHVVSVYYYLDRISRRICSTAKTRTDFVQ